MHEFGLPKLSGDTVQAVAEHRYKGGQSESGKKDPYKFRNLAECRQKRKGWNAWNVCEWLFRDVVPQRHAGRNANKHSVLLRARV